MALLCLPPTSKAQVLLQGDSLQEVVVTGTGTQHLLKNAPVHTEVISSRQLRQYGGKSIEDILGALSSSFAFSEGDMGSQMQLGGLGNNYILVLVDGKRLHGDVGGENDLSLIDPHNIERIEIVKGASSSLYGSDAIAGVVNIITKRHDESFLVENTSRLGSYGDLRQHNALGLAFGQVRSYTNFQLQHSDGWQNTATEYTPSSAAPITDSRSKTVNRHTNWQLAEQLTWSVTPRVELYASGTYYRKGIYRPKGKYPKYDVKTFDLKYRNASASVGGTWHHGLTSAKTDAVTLDIDWNRHAYYHAFTSTTLAEGFDETGRFVLDFPYFRGQQLLQSNQERTMAHLKGVFTLPRNHRLSAGLEARYDYLKAPTSIAGKSADDNTEALYVQDEWHGLLFSRATLHLTPGLRLNRNEGFGLRLTPKLSAMLSLGDLRLRASWSQGFKTPTLKEMNYRYIREMNTVVMYLGNRDLKAQTSNYFSLNGEYTWGGLNLTVTGYYNNVERMIALVTVPRSEAPAEYRQEYGELLGKVRRYQNMEDARTLGIDVSLRYSAREFSAGLGYSYLDTKAHAYDADHDRLVSVTIDGMAHHKGNVFLTWQKNARRATGYGAGLYGRFSTKRYYQIDGDGKGYHIWRLAGNYSFQASLSSRRSPLTSLLFKIDAGIDNIFNYCDRTAHGLHLGTTTAGRTVYATLNVQWKKGKNTKFNNKSNIKNKETENEED
jgi:outer membrane receptor for ferrienterochelin and colicins